MKKKYTPELWEKINSQYWLDVMDEFKYKDHCGFYTKFSGFDRFIIDRVNSPYAQSFFRLSDYDFRSSRNEIIVLCNIGFLSFTNANSLFIYLKDQIDENGKMNFEKKLKERHEENHNNGKDICL